MSVFGYLNKTILCKICYFLWYIFILSLVTDWFGSTMFIFGKKVWKKTNLNIFQCKGVTMATFLNLKRSLSIVNNVDVWSTVQTEETFMQLQLSSNCLLVKAANSTSWNHCKIFVGNSSSLGKFPNRVDSFQNGWISPLKICPTTENVTVA